MENLKNFNEEQEGKQKKEHEESDLSNPYGKADAMMKNAQKSMPSFNTSMPNIKMPNFDMPNFKF